MACWPDFDHPSISHLIHNLTPPRNPPPLIPSWPIEHSCISSDILDHLHCSWVCWARAEGTQKSLYQAFDKGIKMAAASATGYAISAFTVASTISSCKTNSSKPKNKVSVRRLKLFGGLKPENKVMNLGVPLSTEQQFGRLLTVCNAFRGKSRGGALTSTCDHISETIFRVVPIMTGLVLIGVAVGFLLLRVEAAVEESK